MKKSVTDITYLPLGDQKNCIATRVKSSSCRNHMQRKGLKTDQNPCRWSDGIIRVTAHLEKQLILSSDLLLSFDEKLDEENR